MAIKKEAEMNSSGRAAIKERVIQLLYERDAMSEDDLVRDATKTKDHRKVRTVIRDLEEAEWIVRTETGSFRLSEEARQFIYDQNFYWMTEEEMQDRNDEEGLGEEQ